MACTTKQSTINKLTRVLMQDLKATNTGTMTHKEIKDKATADATALVEVRQASDISDFADEVDSANALDGAKLELNANSPKVGNASIKVTEVNNNMVYYKYPNNAKEYSTDPRGLTLSQKNAVEVIGK